MTPAADTDYAKPTSLADALDVRAQRPHATVIAGGTDVMVAVNEGRRGLEQVIDVSDVAELGGWGLDGDRVRIGAALPLTRIAEELTGHLPGLAAAARLVGSPPIRHRATLGGNIGTASPAGDTLPPMLAGGAVIELTSVRGVRHVPGEEFFLAPGRSVLAPDELVTAVHATTARGEAFAKTGTRQAMVISAAAAAVRIDPERHRLGIAFGSVAPTPRRASARSMKRTSSPFPPLATACASPRRRQSREPRSRGHQLHRVLARQIRRSSRSSCRTGCHQPAAEARSGLVSWRRGREHPWRRLRRLFA